MYDVGTREIRIPDLIPQMHILLVDAQGNDSGSVMEVKETHEIQKGRLDVGTFKDKEAN
ncbi:hypothetical protein GCM10007874_30850 [Labrys miyagiensis]|uniref:Uncharacterized protein n=1 Tax=Labrys miyagiensis TaxID=346912 RepID=A0ABQ6CII4_9HYPH|nr:hypothetical protein GCM10007874_30850 [Labrys miyagiensis]